MTQANRDSAADPGLPKDLHDVSDELHTVADLVELIAMTARYSTDSDDAAIGAGCLVIQDKLKAAITTLDRLREGEASA